MSALLQVLTPSEGVAVCSGSDVLATDLNKHDAIDIVTATKLGAFIFLGKAYFKAGK
jgi:hypothetical protein